MIIPFQLLSHFHDGPNGRRASVLGPRPRKEFGLSIKLARPSTFRSSLICGDRKSGWSELHRTASAFVWMLIVFAFSGRNECALALDTASMKAAAEYSAARRGAALLVIQNGKAIFESYPGDHSDQETHKIYSGTKGFWVLAALAAEEEGILKLDERVADTIQEWRSDDRKKHITIRQLLDFQWDWNPCRPCMGIRCSTEMQSPFDFPSWRHQGSASFMDPLHCRSSMSSFAAC